MVGLRRQVSWPIALISGFAACSVDDRALVLAERAMADAGPNAMADAGPNAMADAGSAAPPDLRDARVPPDSSAEDATPHNDARDGEAIRPSDDAQADARPTQACPDQQCPPEKPVCVEGRCLTCSPNPTPTRCSITTPQFCNTNGEWEDVATGQCGPPPSPGLTFSQTCCDGKCTDSSIDANNCGGCGNKCLPGKTCQIGVCLYPPTILAAGLSSPSNLALDQSAVYFVASGSIFSARLGGGTPAVIASGQSVVSGLGVDASGIYWGTSDLKVMKVDLAGGTPVTLFQEDPTSFFSISVIQVNATGVYWLASGTIRKLGSNGTAVSIVNDPGLGSFLIDSANAYWIGFTDGVLKKAPLVEGSRAISVATTGGTYSTLAVDAANAYFLATTATAFEVRKVPLSGATAPVTIASLAYPVTSLAVDSSGVYLGVTSGSIVRTGLDGGPVVTVAQSPKVLNLKLDATFFYWISTSTVMKAPK